MTTDRNFLALVGPTGVGKTELSLQLAARCNAEIVSADSRQVFRALTVGTAKPSDEELRAAPHHFIDELELTDPFSAGIFAEQAAQRIDQIVERGRIPLLVGGSTLYIEALLHGLSAIPPTSEETRTRLMERLHSGEAALLFEELQTRDPETAATLDVTKTQRVVRALEVLDDTGRPLSYYHAARTVPRHRFRTVVLTRQRAELYERIDRRVDRMIAQGLLEENESLLRAGFSPDLNALRTIGYREPLAYLTGAIGYDTMRATLKRNTRRYAKRQLTWFRRRADYRWLDLSEVSEAEAVEFILQ